MRPEGGAKAALLIIDMQREMQRRIDAGRDCVNPEAGARIAALAGAFREAGMPVVHVRHAAADPGAALHPDAPGYPPMRCAEAVAGEAVFLKAGSSGFAGTGLEAHLRAEGIGALVVVGAVAGFCVNTTVRAGSDLGFAMTVVRDGVIGFDLAEAGLSAATIFDVTMAHLAADFAVVADAAEVAASLGLVGV
ncbi:isochorismatase family protein [Tabrizicola sp. M-4]|uniref:isochorismatase family protein n=1 Tax=Tabrizicola sp. M-4 TaxID=3055847 RepID=UPI003DA8EB03